MGGSARPRVDWTRRAGYIRRRHGIEPTWADEAVADPQAIRLTPDPAGRSGLATRIIGYSRSARAVLTVIVVDGEADPRESPHGFWWGSNAWRSSRRDVRIYNEEES